MTDRLTDRQINARIETAEEIIDGPFVDEDEANLAKDYLTALNECRALKAELATARAERDEARGAVARAASVQRLVRAEMDTNELLADAVKRHPALCALIYISHRHLTREESEYAKTLADGGHSREA